MPKILDPTPVVYQVRVETPLGDIYFEKFELMFGADLRVKDWLYNAGRVRRIRQQEPELGRGLVFWVTGLSTRTTKHVADLLAKAEAMFNEREKGVLAREMRSAAGRWSTMHPRDSDPPRVFPGERT
jgi:hypothetical protein